MLRRLIADSPHCSFSLSHSCSCPPGTSIALPMYTSYKLTTQNQISLQERLARKLAYQVDRYAKNRKANRGKNQRYLHTLLPFALPSFAFLSSWTFDLPFPSLVLLAISHLPPRLDRTNSQSSTNRSAVSSRMKRRMAKAVKWSQVAQLRKKWVEVKCKYNESKTLATSHHSSRRAIRNHQTCRLARPIQHSQDCACPTQSTSRSRPHGSLQKAASSW